MSILLKLKLAISFALFATFSYFYQQGGDNQLFMAGFAVWLCGPLFLIGAAAAFVHKKFAETPVPMSTFYLNLLGLTLVVIFAVRSSFTELV